MKSEQGWVKLHRDIKNHWLWDEKPFSRGQAFIDLLLLANHSDKNIPLGNEIVKVAQGSFIISELKLMERWGWSKTKVRAFLKILESDSIIVKKTDRKKTTIFIVNWGKYQNQQTAEEPQKDHKKTEKKPQKDTNKNEKNEKNEKNIKSNTRKFIKPTIKEIADYCAERQNSVDPELFFAHYEARDWMFSKDQKMKSWKHAVIVWEKNKAKWEGDKSASKNEERPLNKYDMY